MTTPKNSASSVFDRTLQSFKNGLDTKERQDFQATDLKQLHIAILAIQTKQASSRTMQNLSRISGFLEAINSYSKVLDVFVNVHDFVAFIWGPIKFLLQVASNFSDAFNELLDAYKRISECLPQLAQYEALFQSRPHMQQILGMIFEDIFEFHRRALKYFKGSAWKQLFQATWKQFNNRFESILSNLQRHKALVETQASLIEFEDAKQHRLFAEQKFRDLEEQERLRRIQALAVWLSAANSKNDQERIAQARHSNNLSGRWLLSHDTVRAWLNPKSHSIPLLCISGKPGAGKTVLASLVVEEALKLRTVSTLYFYFRYDDPQRNSITAMAQSFMAQLFPQNDTLLSFLFEKAVSSGDAILGSEKVATELLKICLQTVGSVFFIVDGLDECPDPQQVRIAQWIQDYVDESSVSQNPCRCLIFSQEVAATRKLLSKWTAFRISPSDNFADIESYCQCWVPDFQTKFEISADEATEIADLISYRADGMFLFARLMMDHLLRQPTKSKLEAEMEDDVLPRELEDAYKRIVNRIFAGPSHGRDAKCLLGWLVIALRPLRWREIQTAVSIDVERGELNFTQHQLRLTSKDLCGSLVEEFPDGTISFVHSTAKRYLTSQEIIRVHDEHQKIAGLCLSYFTLPEFDIGTCGTEDELDYNVLSGCYGFFDYAISNWTIHLELALMQSPPESFCQKIEESLDNLFSLHWVEPPKRMKIPARMKQVMRAVKSDPIYDKLVLTAAAVRGFHSSNFPDTLPFETLTLFRTLVHTRVRLEHLVCDSSNQEPLQKFYGKAVFKCPRLYCKWFYEGFGTLAQRDAHLERHNRSFYCSSPGCTFATLGFSTSGERKVHVEKYHNVRPTDEDFPPEPRARYAPYHGYTCHLCSKGYTTSSNLAVHMRIHSGTKRFKCSDCASSFTRRDAYKRHEASHSGTKKHVCRGVLQSGVVWGCGKPFAHRYVLRAHLKCRIGQKCLPEDVEDAAEAIASIERQQRDESEPTLPGAQSSTLIAPTASSDTPDATPVLSSSTNMCNCTRGWSTAAHKRCVQCHDYDQSAPAAYHTSQVTNTSLSSYTLYNTNASQ